MTPTLLGRGDGAIGHRLIDAEHRHRGQRGRRFDGGADRRAGDHDVVRAGVFRRRNELRHAAGRLRPQLAVGDHVFDQAVVDQVEHRDARQLRFAELLEDRHQRGRRVQQSQSLLRHGR